jgi:hypothetical protein
MNYISGVSFQDSSLPVWTRHGKSKVRCLFARYSTDLVRNKECNVLDDSIWRTARNAVRLAVAVGPEVGREGGSVNWLDIVLGNLQF